jgi:hypothetical protein
LKLRRRREIVRHDDVVAINIRSPCLKQFLNDMYSFFRDLGRGFRFRLFGVSVAEVLEFVGFAFRQLLESK